MKISEKTLTVSDIKSLGIKEADMIGYDYQWESGIDNHYLTVNGHRVVSFTNPSDRERSFKKIKRLGLGLGWKAPLPTDEEEGIIRAAEMGENPFAFTIICANPERNEIVK